MYKSVLSPEELNALLSAEQALELAADSERSAGQASPLHAEKDMERIQQLESAMQQLLDRVDQLEVQLREYQSSVAGAAASQEQADQPSSLANGPNTEVIESPITLSRVEKYKQIPKKKLFG